MWSFKQRDKIADIEVNIIHPKGKLTLAPFADAPIQAVSQVPNAASVPLSDCGSSRNRVDFTATLRGAPSLTGTQTLIFDERITMRTESLNLVL